MEMNASDYAGSAIHIAVAGGDHEGLRRILSSLPPPTCIASPARMLTEAEVIAEKVKASAISNVIDQRHCLNSDTPLMLAVKKRDAIAVQILTAAGADYSLRDAQGWLPVEIALSFQNNQIARILLRHQQAFDSTKWFLEVPRRVAAIRRMVNFYMEIKIGFSSMLSLASSIAPSDTYKIWKVGANLRADTTISDIDGFRVNRSPKTTIFFGEGSIDRDINPGSLVIISHKEKLVHNIFDGRVPSDRNLDELINKQLKENITRNKIDISHCQLNRTKKEKSIGSWRTRMYQLHDVNLCVNTRNVSSGLPAVGSGVEKSRIIESDIWLTEQFPLRLEDLSIIMDILEREVKGVRQFRKLIGIPLPTGTFPVKVAISIIPHLKFTTTIKRFDELQSSPAELSTSSSSQGCPVDVDSFLIPAGYTWRDP